jgi:hypothetical protein
MSEKPEGPIYIDMANNLFSEMTMAQVIHVANLALNRLTMRDIGEIMGEAGLTPRLQLKERDHEEEKRTATE